MSEAFQYKFDINGADQMVLYFTATTAATFAAGDILQFAAGGTVELATAGSTRIAGVAVDPVTSAVAGTKVQVVVNQGAIFRVGYTGTTKTSLAGTDIGVAFDLATGSKTINLDDTTGGVARVVAYDNTAKTADVILISRLLNP